MNIGSDASDPLPAAMWRRRCVQRTEQLADDGVEMRYEAKHDKLGPAGVKCVDPDIQGPAEIVTTLPDAALIAIRT